MENPNYAKILYPPQLFTALTHSKPEAALILSGLGIMIAAQFIHGFPQAAQQLVPGLYLSGGTLLLMGAQGVYRGQLPGSVSRFLQQTGRALGVQGSQVIFLAVACLFSVLAASTIDFGPILRAPSVTIALWGLSIGLVFLGGWQPGARWPGREAWGMALGVTTLALVIRGLFTAQYPPYLTSDEASMGLNAAAFLKGKANNIFNVGWYSFPAFFYYLESFSLRVFGQNIEALRLFAALGGALTVGAVYFLGRGMFGKPTALLAALFLAAFHFHVHFSRTGLNNVWDGLLFTLVLGGLWGGWQRGYRAYFLLAGTALGLAQYLYASTRLLFFLIPVWVLIAGGLDRERLRRAWPGLFWMGVTAFVIAAPLGWYYFNNPEEYWAPLRRVAIDGEWIAGNVQRLHKPPWRVVIEHLSLGLRAYTMDNLSGFYLPKTPLLRPVAGGVFLAGGILLTLHARKNHTWMILLWLLGFGIMTSLTYEPAAAQRFVAAAPAVALLIGFALQEIAHMLMQIMPSSRVPLQWIAILAVLLLAASDLKFYFWDFSPRVAAEPDSNLVANRLAQHFATQPEGTQVFFYGAPRMGFYSHASLTYLAPQVEGFDVMMPPDQLAPHPSGHVIFVLLPEYQEVIPPLQTNFPDGSLYEARTSEGVLLYTLYEGVW